MKHRKMLYGYQIQEGSVILHPEESIIVRRIMTSYLSGLSYQRIADMLNSEAIPYSEEDLLWNKHKIKRLLENPRYAGTDGYPPIIDEGSFQEIQSRIRSRAPACTTQEKRLALELKDCLRCACGGALHRMTGGSRRKDTLYLKCGACDCQFKILDGELLEEVAGQMAEHDALVPEDETLSSEAVRLSNAINRGLEDPASPEEVVSLILQGISARYNCCRMQSLPELKNRLTKADMKRFSQAVSHITISEGNIITVQFK